MITRKEAKNKNLKKFGTHIFYLRQKRNMTQKDVATYMGVTASCISLYEKGTKNPSLHNLLLLAEALGVYPSFLLKCFEDKIFDED